MQSDQRWITNKNCSNLFTYQLNSSHRTKLTTVYSLRRYYGNISRPAYRSIKLLSCCFLEIDSQCDATKYATCCRRPWLGKINTINPINTQCRKINMINPTNTQGRKTWAVINWKHFPRYWPFVTGIHRSPVDSPQKVSDAELWYFLWSAPE